MFTADPQSLSRDTKERSTSGSSASETGQVSSAASFSSRNKGPQREECFTVGGRRVGVSTSDDAGASFTTEIFQQCYITATMFNLGYTLL